MDAPAAQLSQDHSRVLLALLQRLPLTEINWALTGSLGHHLQGVPVSVHDIDIQTDEASAWIIDSLLRDHVRQPASWRFSEKIRSIFGSYELDGVTVELMGALSKRPTPADSWAKPTNPLDHRMIVEWKHLPVPVMSLSYEVQAYRAIGRAERADLLFRYLPKSG